MDFKGVERIVEHIGIGDGPEGSLFDLRGGPGSETGRFGTRSHAHEDEATAGRIPPVGEP